MTCEMLDCPYPADSVCTATGCPGKELRALPLKAQRKGLDTPPLSSPTTVPSVSHAAPMPQVAK